MVNRWSGEVSGCVLDDIDIMGIAFLFAWREAWLVPLLPI